MAALATTELYRSRLHALSAPGGSVYTHMLRTLIRIDTRAKFYLSGVMVGKRSGNLLTSQAAPTILRLGNGNLLGVLQNNATYAKAVHEGTGPHVIRAVNKKALRFQPSVANFAAGTGGGRTASGHLVFRKVVNHPGTEARPFLRTAMHDVILAGH